MKQRLSPPNTDIFFDIFPSPLGNLYLIFSGETLTGIDFRKPQRVVPLRSNKQAARLKKQLGSYFRGTLQEFDQEIDFLEGTDFEREVWLCLKSIPYGETRSYKWLAERIGRPKAVRAVGQALSKNPLPIIVPCHRIIESDGSLGGYSEGVDIKRRLLDLEYYSRQSMGKD
ncbi:MAG TPA: cysteine methyltransferase [Nitrospiraceae bacterium]|jgi:methylated-DNA-[protein]-cysteine S-methyltransferase|nr:cysteine methyltransferase [Nitrospiraceae bacterium]